MTDPNTLPSEMHPAVALLPWYLSGTLPAEEHTAVSAHLQVCPSCRQELDDLTKIRGQVRQASEAGPLPSTGLAQAVLARVREDSFRQTGRSPVTPPVPAAPDSFLAAADRWLRGLLTPQWVPTLVTVLLIGQIGLLTWNLIPQQQPGTGTGTAGTVTSRGLDRTPVRLEIEFQPGATMEQAQTLLQSMQGRVTGGPTATGAFVVELPASGAASVQERTDALRNRRDIIRSVAVMGP